jgi:hypothetical protein
VRQGRISQTALEVALGLVTLSVKDDWAEHLPPGLVETSERLLVASGSPGYGARMMRMARRPWMVRAYELQDLLMPGQFEASATARSSCNGRWRRLSEDGRWSTSLPSVLLAEGLFQYLTDGEVRGLLAEAATCTAPGSRLVFTHAIPGYRRMVTFLTGLIGERWKSAVQSEDLPEYVEGTGWTIVSEVNTNPAHGVERYAVAERH